MVIACLSCCTTPAPSDLSITPKGSRVLEIPSDINHLPLKFSWLEEVQEGREEVIV